MILLLDEQVVHGLAILDDQFLDVGDVFRRQHEMRIGSFGERNEGHQLHGIDNFAFHDASSCRTKGTNLAIVSGL